VCDQSLLDIVSEPGQACVKLAPKFNLPHNCHKSQLPVNVISKQKNKEQKVFQIPFAFFVLPHM
jgi:hypothetical protein